MSTNSRLILGCCISFTLGEPQSAFSLSKIPKKSELKYSKLSATLDLKNKQFYSSKERPELNPVLSALINEDIKKSIDAKRHAEVITVEPPTTTGAPPATTTTPIPILTTTSRQSLSKSVNDGLSGDPESLDEAGSENKQTSRIQVKKGPNGVDYEYEYVYYYYDDDEKDAKNTTEPTASSTTTDRAPEKDVVRLTGKNRYASLERNASSTSKPAAAGEFNEIPSSRGKGRQVIPVVEEVVEERLPANTRFPPRSLATNAPSVSVVSTVDETTKRISVKRPSLELVDSHSFSRGDKKGSRVINDSEFSRNAELKDKSVIPLSTPTSLPTDASTTSVIPPTAPSNDEPTTAANEWPELTTQIMDRVALDLYAHLVNENSIADATTTPESGAIADGDDALAGHRYEHDDAVTTDVTATTTSSNEDYTTYIAATSTTEAATTTTTTTTTAAPSTTSTESTLLHGRKSPFSGRNRFRLRPSTETVERKEAATESSALKPKNRFSRPSYSRTRPAPPTAAADAVDESVAKEEKPAVAASPIRGRTRNRFNVRPSSVNNNSTTAAEKATDENADNVAAGQSTTTQRTARPRPTFNLRGRSRPTIAPIASTAAAASEAEESPAASQAADNAEPKQDAEKPSPKPGSRFNLRRPNQLLSARGRVSPLLKSAPSTEAPAKGDGHAADGEKDVTAVTATDNSNNNNNKEASADDGDQANTETSTPPQSGLNRLRNRPRIQIKPRAPASTENKSSTIAAYNVNRKANPLIARRKIGTSTSTTEEPVSQDETTVKDDEVEGDSDDDAKDEPTEAAVVEVTSEQPRSLGILGNRRRLPLRKPGTILHTNQN